MTLDPSTLAANPDIIEGIEKATLRLVAQAVYDFRETANEIFLGDPDLVADIGEDITREALDRIGTSVIPVCLFGKIDYKRARYVFHPEYAARQALFVDSKAEKVEGVNTATIQLSQTSLRVRQNRAGREVDEPGSLPAIIASPGGGLLTTTIFVKYNYRAGETHNDLVSISLVGLPNGLLQERYNPNAADTFWRAGRNAPSRGEAFRARIGLPALKGKANWRVQHIQLTPELAYQWDE